ncbi:carboxylesterase/lipase family protein [Sphingomonas cavernae]|uniref:Carboxylic ester hydrolase n=1 Tax=Sphingomonas cavernae TaxID=2320861 RepID=A0A418WLQ5_9SPHN|nr:carboxylesterase/lipase family protein [Sphingomonas cavernae]RJF90947.1 carboxylesterase/lipase family protein [Sphingomonas cavernae]
MFAARLTRRAALAGGLAFGVAPAILSAKPSADVRAAGGRYAGLSEHGVKVFRGIRYGEDTRQHRFRAAAAPKATHSIQQAVEFAASCPQKGDRYARTSEDCLFLNIWTPETDPRARRPVMVYIHGGAYSTGSVIDPLNYGHHLAARGDAVVVTINHRLNALGYLYLSRLDPRFADSGNVGQLDLILALQWVRDNIAAFGGDPGRVMVFGQSGGGAKIATMMGMPAAKGLFHSAATMSGQQVTASGPLNATARTRAYLAALGVAETNLDALLELPTERLVEALEATDPVLGGGVYMGPVLDMKWLTRHPFWPDPNPQSNAIPMILGNTHDETRGFFGPDHPRIVGIDWDNLADRIAPELKIDILPEWVVAEFRERYPRYSPADIFYAATTAGRSWRGQVEEADARARAGARATWVYQLDFPSPVRPERGAPHTHDIPLVFGTLDAEGSLTGTGADAQRVSEQMMRAFAALARAGSPAHADLPDWPGYTLPQRTTMVFDRQTRAMNDPRQWERELFARVPYIQPGS